MARVELYLLGGFELAVDGQAKRLQPAMQRLVAFVALAPRGIERCFTAFQLWPDDEEGRAKANLRSTLWRLGKLEPDLIAATKSHLCLAEDVWVDARHGVQALAQGSNSSVLDTMLPFHVLQAELLPDWYDEWLLIERERLRQLSLRALETRARSALDCGQAADAIQVALAAVAIDPLRESSRRLVMEAHLAEGNKSEAQREFQHYCARLAVDPVLSPSTEMRALVGSSPTMSQPHPAVSDRRPI